MSTDPIKGQKKQIIEWNPFYISSNKIVNEVLQKKNYFITDFYLYFLRLTILNLKSVNLTKVKEIK